MRQFNFNEAIDKCYQLGMVIEGGRKDAKAVYRVDGDNVVTFNVGEVVNYTEFINLIQLICQAGFDKQVNEEEATKIYKLLHKNSNIALKMFMEMAKDLYLDI